MSGVEILTSQEVAVEFGFNEPAFWIVAGIIFVVSILIGAIGSIHDGDIDCFLLCSIGGVFIASIFGTIVGAIFEEPAEYQTQYQVTVSDEVSMNEFYERYEVIDIDGKIYTVAEKE